MLRLRPHDAESRYLRARIAEAEVLAAPAPQPTDWQPVVAQYRRALCVPSSVGSSLADEAERQLRLGGALERAGEQAAAADAYARAVGLGSADTPVPVEWRYRLARAEELAGRPDRSQARYREALDAEPDSPAFLYSMLEMTPKNFGARRQVARFVVDQADTIRARAETPSGDGARGLHRPVFVYWGQGYAAAPAVVRTCIHRFRSVVPAERLHLLTAETVPYYVTLSAPVRAMAETDPTHFADVLRAALLARYGGAWLDATCFAGPGFLDELDRLADAEYFAFRYEGPPKISNWFMTSVPGGYIARQIDAALRVYWESRRVKGHYFLDHYLFAGGTPVPTGAPSRRTGCSSPCTRRRPNATSTRCWPAASCTSSPGRCGGAGSTRAR